MKKSMEAFIGNDFERGLRMLKDWTEDGAVHSQLNYTGFGEYAGCQYIGLKRSFTTADASNFMTQDFTKLMGDCRGNENTNAAACFCIYHEWDLIKGKVTYTAGVPVHSMPNPSGRLYFRYHSCHQNLHPPTFGQLQPPGQCMGYLVCHDAKQRI